MDDSGKPARTHNDKGRHEHDHSSPKGDHRKCEPKKGGAGGHNWGKPGDELYAPSTSNDPHDPNFDDLESPVALRETKYTLTKEEMVILLTPHLQEFFDNADISEVEPICKAIEDNSSNLCPDIAALIVRRAIEQNDPERELASVLLSALYGKRLLAHKDIAAGMDQLMKDLQDMELDTPDAPEVLGKFMARCVADDCLPPAYIHTHPAAQSNYANPAMRACMKKARVLISMNHGLARLDEIWGFAGGRRPVEDLIRKLGSVLAEYLSALDATEVARCLHDLKVPHFHHEFVFEAILKCLENGPESREAAAICVLLKDLYDRAFITVNQMTLGIRRVHDKVKDIQLDIPNAGARLVKVVQMGIERGFVEPAMADLVVADGQPS